MEQQIIVTLVFCFGFLHITGLDLDVSEEGYWGVILNAAVEFECDLQADSTQDFGDNLTLHWYNTNTGSHKESILKNASRIFLADSNFDTSIPWLFYTHGFGASAATETTILIRDTFMELPNYYIFILDHSNYTSSSIHIYSAYQTAVTSVYPISENLKTLFFDNMIAAGVRGESIHMIGHSLGAHIIGKVGSLLQEDDITIEKCTGLDPAGPCFISASKYSKLSSGDCKFVEVIHTNQGQLGSKDMISDFEAFANCAGKMQPHCISLGDNCYVNSEVLQSALYTTGLISSCSHSYAVTIYANTVNRTVDYYGTLCNDFVSFKTGQCQNNDTQMVGFHSNPLVNYMGAYYFTTEECDCELNF